MHAWKKGILSQASRDLPPRPAPAIPVPRCGATHFLQVILVAITTSWGSWS